MTRLKPKNRKRLEDWLIEQVHDWMENIGYRDFVITDGFPGVYNCSDAELLDEYKIHIADLKGGY